MANEAAKARAAAHVVALVEAGMTLGLGTGSTVRPAIEALAARRLDVTCVATSERTRALAASLGLRVRDPDGIDRLDLAFDGADEVDPALNLVKGGGGAHAREKIVAARARRFVVIVDASKEVARLGAAGVPLAVLPFAPAWVAERVRALGAVRIARREARSDDGAILLDAWFGPIDDPPALAAALDAIPGLVEHGIFPASLVERVVVGTADGVRERRNPARPGGLDRAPGG